MGHALGGWGSCLHSSYRLLREVLSLISLEIESLPNKEGQLYGLRKHFRLTKLCPLLEANLTGSTQLTLLPSRQMIEKRVISSPLLARRLVNTLFLDLFPIRLIFGLIPSSTTIERSQSQHCHNSQVSRKR